MDNRKTALFGAVIAIAAGLFGANAAQINNSQSAITNSLAGGSPIYGHITVEAKDKSGHVFAYRQSDNLIVNQGLNCLAMALFRAPAATDRNACGGIASTVTGYNTLTIPNSGGFRFIWIGTGTGAPDATQNALVGPVTGTGTNTGIGIESGNVVFTPMGTGTTGTGTVPGIQILISAGTLGVTAVGQPVDEAGIFDGTNTGVTLNMFARQTFPVITMSTGDTLTVTWSLTFAH